MKSTGFLCKNHFIYQSFFVTASSAHAGGDEEDQLLNTNACVNCDLSNARLEEAKLRKADLSGSNLYRANLEYADLRGANFTGADLSNARLRGANLTNAILDNAILRYTKPRRCKFKWGKLKSS